MKRIMSIVGARPQFIKAASVCRAMAKSDRLTEILVHTGQHFDNDMSQIFFDELEIPAPRHNLGIHGGGHGDMTGRMLSQLEAVMTSQKLDAVLVYGDTNSTLAGGLAAAKLHIPVIHIEAGLRSFNRRMPEEINRVLVDHLSALLFCPTRTAVDNLAREGIEKGVHHAGDVMYDATMHIRDVANKTSAILQTLEIEAGGYNLCTIHRAENTDDMDRLARLLAFIDSAAGDRAVIFPVHPRTRDVLKQGDFVPQRIRLIDPVGYKDIHRLISRADAVFTDSGGMQKEAYFHRVPCVTLRDETEWVETIDAGWNRLWTSEGYAERREILDFGTGDAAEQIVATISQSL